MKNIFIIGMGMSDRDLTPAQLEVVGSADFLVGGHRHLDYFSDLAMDKHAITGRIDQVFDAIRQRKADERIVVLASGDPLFYGIGARLINAFGQDRVTVLPNITAVSAAFARINTPWHDARIVSLHGRNRRYHVLEALKNKSPVAVLTDRQQTPGWLAGWLMDQGVAGIKMVVFEQMGTPQECICRYDPAGAAGKAFAQPNMVILLHEGKRAASVPFHLGMPDSAYAHERGLITKAEVRAVTLAKLCLKPGHILWDLGAGSGSVGIEASILLGPGRIIAVEEKSERIAAIKANARLFGVYNHDTLQARLPEGLEKLPDPDRVFIGGGGRDLKDIVRKAAERLTTGGIIVVNTVLLDNMTAAIAQLEASGLNAEVIQLQVNRNKDMPWSRRLEAGNPVWIITGEK